VLSHTHPQEAASPRPPALSSRRTQFDTVFCEHSILNPDLLLLSCAVRLHPSRCRPRRIRPFRISPGILRIASVADRRPPVFALGCGLWPNHHGTVVEAEETGSQGARSSRASPPTAGAATTSNPAAGTTFSSGAGRWKFLSHLSSPLHGAYISRCSFRHSNSQLPSQSRRRNQNAMTSRLLPGIFKMLLCTSTSRRSSRAIAPFPS